MTDLTAPDPCPVCGATYTLAPSGRWTIMHGDHTVPRLDVLLTPPKRIEPEKVGAILDRLPYRDS